MFAYVTPEQTETAVYLHHFSSSDSELSGVSGNEIVLDTQVTDFYLNWAEKHKQFEFRYFWSFFIFIFFGEKCVSERTEAFVEAAAAVAEALAAAVTAASAAASAVAATAACGFWESAYKT